MGRYLTEEERAPYWTMYSGDQVCMTCRWWVETEPMNWGEVGVNLYYDGFCRCHAPRPGLFIKSDDAIDTVWPITDYYEFCGEWKEKG